MTLDTDITLVKNFVRQNRKCILKVVFVEELNRVHLHSNEVQFKCICSATCLRGNNDNNTFNFITYLNFISEALLQETTQHVARQLFEINVDLNL